MEDFSRNKNEGKHKMKGIAPLAILVIVGLLAVEGVILTDLLGKTDNIVRAARETEIIRLINEMEFAKRYLSQALSYAYYQAAYELAKNGGYTDLGTANSHNCIAYWREYDTASVPNYEDNFRELFVLYFNKYGTALKSEVKVPVYDDAKFDMDTDSISVSANNELRVDTDAVRVRDASEFTQKVDPNPFLLFDIGREIFDEISPVTSSANYGEASGKMQFIENKYASLYGEKGFDITISSENAGSSNDNYALRALVSIETRNKYSYSNTQKTLGENTIMLEYYVIFGTENIAHSEQCI